MHPAHLHPPRVDLDDNRARRQHRLGLPFGHRPLLRTAIGPRPILQPDILRPKQKRAIQPRDRRLPGRSRDGGDPQGQNCGNLHRTEQRDERSAAIQDLAYRHTTGFRSNTARARDVIVTMFLRRLTLAAVLLLMATRPASAAQTRDQMVLSDRDDVLGGGKWIYNDLAKGLSEARATGKPLLVVLRCVPCVACAAFDGEVLRYDAELQKLMERFVRVRIIQGNGLDLSLFQFDTDVSFAAFFLNADRVTYGRYGTRSERVHAEKDISMEGFRAALAGALELHKGYPANKESLSGKQPLPVKFASPEKYPALSSKYSPTLDYSTGKVAASCIHCHMLGEAQRKVFRADRQPIPDDLLRPYPMPKVIGFSLDPKTRQHVSAVMAGSAADKAGLK